jgi:DNA-binding CsgD family transcriptional regulator
MRNPTIAPVEHRGGAAESDLPGQLAALAALANDLAGEFALEPLLEHILRNAVELLGCQSGSICTIDQERQVYRKEVDLDVGCRSGEVFPLDEGVTGAVVRAGGAVTFERYSAVPGGHIRAGDARRSRAVIGVPIRLSSGIIGTCVVFGDDPNRIFDERDARLLELFSIHAAVAIANSRLLSGQPRIAGWRHPVEELPAQGRLTVRERQVAALVECGWPDKRIAAELGISFKTVEKHVGVILRKSGALNRTELAARAATRGVIDRSGSGSPAGTG